MGEKAVGTSISLVTPAEGRERQQICPHLLSKYNADIKNVLLNVISLSMQR